MSRRRSDKGTHTPAPARSPDRVEVGDGGWFVRTREGVRGPFPTRAAAEQETAAYVETMEYLDRNGRKIPAGVDRQDVEIVNLRGPLWR